MYVTVQVFNEEENTCRNYGLFRTYRNARKHADKLAAKRDKQVEAGVLPIGKYTIFPAIIRDANEQPF